jgi:ribosomal protein S12 methylthiotransferase
MDVLDVMAERDNICKYLDMPLQHGSTRILQAMRRGITREKTEALIQTIREKVPGIALRTTLISGYPGETEADFEETYSFVERMRFDRLGIFNYSHEENTHAYSVEDNVPEDVKQERSDEIMALQQTISEELNQAKVGQTVKVLVDRKESGYFVGRTEFDSPEVDNEVLIPAEQYARLGDFVHVKINKAEEFDLYGDIVNI